MAYTYRRTGSARSVGRRRIIKLYATSATGVAIAARSAAGARQDAQLAGLTITGSFFSGTPTTTIDRRTRPVGVYVPPAVTPTKIKQAPGTTLASVKDLTALNAGYEGNPKTAWTTGQKVTLGDTSASAASWNGTAWVTGAADDPDADGDYVNEAEVTVQEKKKPKPKRKAKPHKRRK